MNRMLARIARTMAEMEQGRCGNSALDTMVSPLAARRIQKQVDAAQAARRASGQRMLTEPVKILSTTSMNPTAGVTEGVVVVQVAERVRAFSVRLEQEGERWRIVDLASPEMGLNAAVTEASRTGAVPVDDQGMRRSSGGNSSAFSVEPLPDDPTLQIQSDE
jgi:hypothetical protein